MKRRGRTPAPAPYRRTRGRGIRGQVLTSDRAGRASRTVSALQRALAKLRASFFVRELFQLFEDARHFFLINLPGLHLEDVALKTLDRRHLEEGDRKSTRL